MPQTLSLSPFLGLVPAQLAERVRETGDVSTPFGIRFRMLPTKRFNAIATSAPGTQLLRYNPALVGLVFYNIGTDSVFIDDNDRVDVTKFPIRAGDSLSFQAPYAPINEFWALANVGHDLRIMQVIVY